MQKIQSLDIGCGGAYRGSINCDLKNPCDVMCDAHYLPFRNRVFMKSILNHILEHCRNPVKVLNEALRVSRFTCVVVPASFHPYSHLDKSHLWFFSGSWFKKYAEAKGLKISGTLRFDSERSFFYLPVELCVYLRKALEK